MNSISIVFPVHNEIDNLERLISLSDEKNAKVDLYSAISILIQGTN